ncbi:hypothetical protein BHU72_04180 [Desulfuribacillus stibiiarsenatis]|uniref:EamA domain-containing protein n=1 Tax=Desulfuribacillus stibiiarsenatis TaxID=1390249 RepID=A0A1E5L5P9_9FIRM|nr:EamA family transporter RarD [Desulfuribacillus stibiiarsenatis]OEH85299.1 hypothetical protein BHU72_04180 [Desulfuribacillus stibiiarsenatis]
MDAQSSCEVVKEQRLGVMYAVLAYVLWGVLPLYWKMLDYIPTGEILAHRVFWSCVFMFGVIAVFKLWNPLKEVVVVRRKRISIFFCAIFISINWFTYIGAVNSDQLVEASFGYFITPIFSVLLAVVVLKERLNFWQGVALGLVCIGVLVMIFQYGRMPWMALVLASSFAMYGLIKKKANIDSIVGLTIETAYVTPIAILYLLVLQVTGKQSFHMAIDSTNLLLIGAGAATALPLIYFAQAAKRASLATLGFTQYLAPSISLGIGVLLFKEPFTLIHGISFGFIWCALFFYSFAKAEWMLRVRNQIFATFLRKTVAVPPIVAQQVVQPVVGQQIIVQSADSIKQIAD